MKQIFPLRLVAVLLSTVLLSGCYTLHYQNTTAKPVSSNPAPAGYKQIQHISEDAFQMHLFWGLVPVAAEGQDKAFREYLANGDAIVNARSKQQREIIGWLVTNFTWGIVNLTYTEFDGDLVKKA